MCLPDICLYRVALSTQNDITHPKHGGMIMVRQVLKFAFTHISYSVLKLFAGFATAAFTD